MRPRRCSRARASVREDHTARPIGAAEHERLAQLVDGASADGFRWWQSARGSSRPGSSAARRAVAAASLVDADRLEHDLVFEGVILFSDPAKAGVGDTIAELAHQGVALKVVTGDNELVARHVAAQVGLAVEGVLTGEEMRSLTHPALVARASGRRSSPGWTPTRSSRSSARSASRARSSAISGDGINDAPALHVADVGISVDNATDVARSAADIILLEPSLAAIGQGVTEGRRTFANTLKYIRMGTSSNFGNMLSMAGAALLLPFLPMTPGQILLNNLIYDASQTAIPTDTSTRTSRPSRPAGTSTAIQRFMLIFGPISSVFDFVTFGLLLLVLGRQRAGLPHRLVHRVAVHPGPRGPGHPDSAAARSGGAGPAAR